MWKNKGKILTEEIADGTGVKIASRVEKFSGMGLTFNERVLYADEHEIRYYSKVKHPKNPSF